MDFFKLAALFYIAEQTLKYPQLRQLHSNIIKEITKGFGAMIEPEKPAGEPIQPELPIPSVRNIVSGLPGPAERRDQ